MMNFRRSLGLAVGRELRGGGLDKAGSLIFDDGL